MLQTINISIKVTIWWILLQNKINYSTCTIKSETSPRQYLCTETMTRAPRKSGWSATNDLLTSRERVQSPDLIVDDSVELVRLERTNKKSEKCQPDPREPGGNRPTTHRPARGRSWAPGTGCCRAAAPPGPCTSSPSSRARADEAGGGDEGLLKLLPHDLLARVFALWILGEQREALH